MNVSLTTSKSNLRRRMRAVREEIAEPLRAAYARAVAQFMARSIIQSDVRSDVRSEPTNTLDLGLLAASEVVVSSYRPMGAEFDPQPTEQVLRQAGCRIALPVAPPPGKPLYFRSWTPGEPLERHRFGMLEPPAHLPVLRPDALLVPLLAFDRRGYRLGYGGGYYDRTLEGLRKTGGCIAIGLAFCEQEVDAVPHDAYDQPLDCIVTPHGMRFFEKPDD
jgi:5-formyltetrahydrofolate cyclo-ligase